MPQAGIGSGWNTSNADSGIVELLARLAMPAAETTRMNEAGTVLSALWMGLAS